MKKSIVIVLIFLGCIASLQARRARPVLPLDGEWYITKLASKKLPTGTVTSVLIYTYNNRMDVNVGCNSINIPFELSGTKTITCKDGTSTEMFCEGPGMQREKDFNKNITKVTSYKMAKDNNSVTFYSGKTIVMVLKRGVVEKPTNK